MTAKCRANFPCKYLVLLVLLRFVVEGDGGTCILPKLRSHSLRMPGQGNKVLLQYAASYERILSSNLDSNKAEWYYRLSSNYRQVCSILCILHSKSYNFFVKARSGRL